MISSSNMSFKGRVSVYNGSNEIASKNTGKDSDVDERMLYFVENFLKSPDIKLKESDDGRFNLNVDNFTLSTHLDDFNPASSGTTLVVDLAIGKDKINGNDKKISWQMFNFEGYPELTSRVNELINTANKKIEQLINGEKENQLSSDRAMDILIGAVERFTLLKPNF